MSENAVTIIEQPRAPQRFSPISVGEILGRKRIIDECMKKTMQDGIHYGKIPGCGDKPTLLKPGAETLCSLFCFAVQLNEETVKTEDLGNGHRNFIVITPFVNYQTGEVVGSGIGSCSTMESKYRFRNADKICPHCGAEAIKRSKPDKGGGWYCWSKLGGCGATFAADCGDIVNQKNRVEHDNPSDYYNTCLKIAKKRAQIDGVLTILGVSDQFTQDIEEMSHLYQQNGNEKDNKHDASAKQKETTHQPSTKLDLLTEITKIKDKINASLVEATLQPIDEINVMLTFAEEMLKEKFPKFPLDQCLFAMNKSPDTFIENFVAYMQQIGIPA